GARQHEEHQAEQLVEDDLHPPREPELPLRIMAPMPGDPPEQRARGRPERGRRPGRRGAHAAAACSARSRWIVWPSTTPMTTIQTAMDRFLTQKGSSPSHAMGPSSASPVKAAGAKAAATRRLKCATQRLNTGLS